jgi:hypothetical protein
LLALPAERTVLVTGASTVFVSFFGRAVNVFSIFGLLEFKLQLARLLGAS